jgi:hypothetical protein
MAETKTWRGGCHCGRVRYEIEAEIGQVYSCNCSYCQPRGFLWSFVPPAQFRLRAGEGEMTEYLFHKKVIHHLFCPACGVESFATGDGPDGGQIAINVRCLDDIDLDALKIVPFDGRSL